MTEEFAVYDPRTEAVKRRQAQAQALIDNPILEEAMNHYRKLVWDGFCNSSPGEDGDNQRRDAYYMDKALTGLLQILAEYARDVNTQKAEAEGRKVKRRA